MLKFKFNYLQNTLAIHREGNTWHQLPEEKQFENNFGGIGFKLEGRWISFDVYESKIRAFYKQMDSPAWFTYYRQDLPKKAPVIFAFTEQDQVEKINGKWTQKGGNHA
ncbi:MAG: hypothetical protein MRECE_2c032 [Mycoplasmataceae bacterium CE_OT135]|nr:MAG: hypothetical protein MRECE_2c032 [Mycoplasmataceae bacterium CE_OT135]